MFERVGIENRIGVKMKDDEELEMLLDEIPHATSFNLHHPHSNGYYDYDGRGDHGHGSNVRHKVYEHTCVSPVSGFSLKSDGSSSSLFSGGSPTPSPLEEVKPHLLCGTSGSVNRSPDCYVDKRLSESNFHELNLSRNFGKMYINEEQESGLIGPNSFQSRDHSVAKNMKMVSEKYWGFDNSRKGFSDFGGLASPVPVTRNPLGVSGQVASPVVRSSSYDIGGVNLYAMKYSPGLSNGLVSELNSSSSAIDSQLHQTKVPTSPLYQIGIPFSDLPSNVTSNAAASFPYAPRNGRYATEDSNNVPHLTHIKPHIDSENVFYSHQTVSNGRYQAHSNARMPNGNLEAFDREDSFIIQGEHVKYGMSNGHRSSMGHTSKRSVHETSLVMPQEKTSQIDGCPQIKGVQESGLGGRFYFPFSQPLKLTSLGEAQGYIYHIAKDQHGCRFLQRMFDEGTPRDVQIIFSEIIDHAAELMMNPFGNYLMQKLLEVCNEEQRMEILLRVTEEPGQLVRISLNTHGTRVVQKLIETLKTRQQISLVVSSLEPGFLALIKDLNGNHVIQRCLQYLTNGDSKFIFVAAAKYCVDIATHQHGCCVLQRCIAHATGEHRENLVAEISANGLLLAQDAFGNYVVQFIMELKIPSVTSKLMSHFEGNFVHLSTQKFSSHVVEKCLIVCDYKVQSKIIHELVSATHFEQLLQDPHANYVVQTALRISEGCLHSSLLDAIESHKAISRNSPYSKRIFSNKLWKK
ncbi:PREDICTED: pumilio homology domain family member 4-like [Ipomoea nil]|uniref:pumilio homology domain family member 4-like n=1 Tax=Ipomoea nil TaxID=35883 RepID=UPI000901A4B6|nr:PREDICTED: pumilio homology domain family member 4-like [Ipomoea nil]